MKLLEDMISNPRKHRIGCGPRLSLEESVYRVRDFRLVQEAKDAKADISEPKLLAAKKASSNALLEKFKKNQRKDPATTGKSLDSAAEELITSEGQTDEDGALNNNLKPIPDTADVATGLDSVGLSNEQLCKSDNEVIQILLKRIQELQDENMALKLHIKRLDEENTDGRNNYFLLLKAKEEMEKECLNKILKIAQEKSNSTKFQLLNIASTTTDKSKEYRDIFHAFQCKIKELKDATGGNVEDSKDRVFMGCDTYLPRAVAIDMNEKEEHFIARVLGLLRGMWPTDLKVRSLKGPDDDNPELVKIPTLVIKSIQVILNMMSWDKDEFKRVRDATRCKRKVPNARKRKRLNDDSDSAADSEKEKTDKAPSSMRISQAMVRYGVRKATCKAREGVKRILKPKVAKPEDKLNGQPVGKANGAKKQKVQNDVEKTVKQKKDKEEEEDSELECEELLKKEDEIPDSEKAKIVNPEDVVLLEEKTLTEDRGHGLSTAQGSDLDVSLESIAEDVDKE